MSLFSMKLFPAPDFRLKWEPKEDITAYELAQCMSVILAANGPSATSLLVRGEFFKLTDDAKRHFTVLVDADANPSQNWTPGKVVYDK